ncbi:hypothetical protein HDU67_002361 [Dinochytrium kinnereticum]|nr:hypothetical protein HDU67_002361 [Dinochytrium kinnereticum]
MRQRAALIVGLVLLQTVSAQIELPTNIPIPTLPNPFSQPTQAPAPAKPCTKDSDCLTSGITNAVCLSNICVDPSIINSATTSTSSPPNSAASQTATPTPVCALNQFSGCLEKIKTPLGYGIIAGVALLIILCFSCLFCCLCKVCCFAVKTTKAVAGAGLSITSSAAKGVARAAAAGGGGGSSRGRGDTYTTDEERRRPPSVATVQNHRERIYGDRAAASGGYAAAAVPASSAKYSRNRYDDYEERGYSDGPAPLPSNFKKPPQLPLEKKEAPREYVDITGDEAVRVNRNAPGPSPPRVNAEPLWNASSQQPSYQPYAQPPGRAYDPYAPYGNGYSSSNNNAPPPGIDPYAMAGYQNGPPNQGLQLQSAGYNPYGQNGQYNNGGYNQSAPYPQHLPPPMGPPPVIAPPQQQYPYDQGYDTNGGPYSAPYGADNGQSEFNGSNYVNGSVTNYNNYGDMGSSFNGGTPIPAPATLVDDATKATDQGAGNVAKWAEQQRMQLETDGFEDAEVESHADSQGVNPATMARRDAGLEDDEENLGTFGRKIEAKEDFSGGYGAAVDLTPAGGEFASKSRINEIQDLPPPPSHNGTVQQKRDEYASLRDRGDYGNSRQGTLDGPIAMAARSKSREGSEVSTPQAPYGVNHQSSAAREGNDRAYSDYPSAQRQISERGISQNDRYGSPIVSTADAKSRRDAEGYGPSTAIQATPSPTAYRSGSGASGSMGGPRPTPPQHQRSTSSGADSYNKLPQQMSPTNYEPPQDPYRRSNYDAPRSAAPYSAGAREDYYGPRSAGANPKDDYYRNAPPSSADAGRYASNTDYYGDDDRRGRGGNADRMQRSRSKSRAPPQASMNPEYRY